jgi:acid phosphatase
LLFLAVLALSAAPLSLPAQQSHKPVFSSNAAAERIPSLGLLKNHLREYHDCTCKCGCYAKDLDLQANRAIAFLDRRAARRSHGEKLALVLDIDETSLSNWQELQTSDFAFAKKDFDAWTDAGQVPAIPGTVRLVKEANRLGVAVFFITGRSERQREPTERNLHAQGYETWQQLFLRQPGQGSQPTIAYKSAGRAQIVAQGYKIVLNVGDQWSDLKGAPEAEFSIKYPNPFYYIP